MAKWWACNRLWIAIGLVLLAQAVLAAPGTPILPDLLPYTRGIETIDFCGEVVPLGNRPIQERLEKELLLTIWDRPQVVLWLKRTTRYMPIVTSLLKEAGLPEDLKYVPLVESALRPHVKSPKGAVGYWQFIPATGRKYGLVINRRMDERRNIHKSTRAAIAYFRDLYRRFDSWTLSAAAYNMGETGLKSAILAQRTNYFYDLYLPSETQRYLFRIHSAKLIVQHPQRFGFHMQPEDYYPPVAFDRVKLKLPKETPIQLIAQAANTTFLNIKNLNPELRGYYVPRSTLTLAVPQGSGQELSQRVAALSKTWQPGSTKRTYVVRKGDNLTRIAKKFNVPVQSLMAWNNIKPNGTIHPNQRLIIRKAPKGSKTSR